MGKEETREQHAGKDPWARSWVATVTATVASMTAEELLGWVRIRRDCQLKARGHHNHHRH